MGNKVLIRSTLPSYCWVLVLVVAIVAPLSAQTPVANWTFDQGSGTTVFDSTGNSHDAILSSGARWVLEGNSWAISGQPEHRGYISLPPVDLSSTQAVTIAFWAKRNYTTSGGTVLFEAGNNYQDSTTGFALLPDDETCHGMQAAVRGNEGTTANCYSQPTSGVWHHLAIIYDKTQTAGNAVALYVDGVLQVPTWNLSSATNTNTFGQNPIYLFSRAGNSQFSSGALRDFRIYDSALNADQVQQIYSHSGVLNSPATGLMAAYSFNEGSGSALTDVSGHGNNGTISNATWIAAGKYGKALLFNGLNSLVTVNDSSSLHLSHAMTLEAWVKPALVSNVRQGVINKGNDGYFLAGTTEQQGFPAGGATVGPTPVVSQGKTLLAANSWSHLAITFNGSFMRLYVNGIPVASEAYRGRIATSTNPLQIGGDSALGRYFNGAIDEIRIYNTALTQPQIQNDMGSPINQNDVGSLAQTTFSITASPTSLSIAQGNYGTSTITTTISGRFNSSISLSASGAPSGTTITFNPATIPAPGSGQSTMTISVGSSTATGTYPITITGNGGGVRKTTTVTLTVTSSGGGGGGGITLDGNAHGVHDNGYTSSTTAAVAIGTPTAGDLITCEVTFDSGSGNSLVSVSDNVNGSYAAAVPMYLDSSMVQWFGIYYKQNVAGSATTATLTTSASRPYAAISCQAWKGVATSSPLDTGFAQWRAASGANPNTGSNKTPSGNGELVIAASAMINSGTPTAGANYGLIDGATTTRWWPEYWVQGTATGTAGNYTWPSDTWCDLMAAFKPASPSGGFALSASPASLTVAQGNQGTSTITTTINNGFNSSISLSAAGAPSGTTVTFNPATIPAPGSGTSTMTINVGASTPAGTYPITVTGNGGGTQQTAIVTLTVTAAGSFTLSASPTSLSVAQGNQGTSTITTTISNGFNSSVSLSAAGVPTGTTVTFNPTSIPAPGSGTSTMSITVGSSTPTGTYPITVTGSGGGVQQTATVTLTVTAAANYSISASPASLSIARGNQGTSTITSTISNGFNNSISLSASGVPSGTTVTFNPTSIPAPGSGSSAMTITVGSGTATGTYPITVTGNGGGVQRTTTVTLTVTAAASFSLSASPASLSIAQGNQGTSTITSTISNGFNSSISLSASGLPSGTTVAFNPTTIPAPGSGTSSMTITVGSGTPAGTYPITVTGNGGGTQQTTTVTLTVTAPNFTISASPASLSIAKGNQGTSTITTAISGGFNGSVTLSASGAPSGTTVSFNPGTIPAPGSGTSSMTIAVGSGTATGTYPITVTGNGGGLQRTTTVTLTVTAAATFTLSASPASLSIMQGSQGTSTITSTLSNGFNSSISLSASGMPAGTTITFNPTTIPAPGSGSSVMTITVAATTHMGTYPITVTGNGGGVQQTVTLNLTVTAYVALSWTASGSPGVAGYNIYRGTTSGGPYTKMNSSLDPNTNLQ